MSGPVAEFMKRHAVEMRDTLEVQEVGQANEVVPGTVVRLTRALANVSPTRNQERVDRLIPLVGIALPDPADCQNAVRQPLALVDVENCVLPQHGHGAGRLSLLLAPFAHLQLLDEIDLGAVPALAHVTA
jgi:hypothetical protein